MCGRYNITPDAEAFVEAFDIVSGLERLSPEPQYNLAPGTPRNPTLVPIVRMSAAGRELALVQWPLIPFWARGHAVAFNTANAKGETVASKPAYREPWRQRRCLVPAHGYYEWRVEPRQTVKQPFHIRLSGGGLFAFGGLWDRSKGNHGRVIESCSIVTTEPPAALRAIHARMPVIVPPQGYQDWLAGSEAAAAHWIRPYDAAQLAWYPVSTYVNNPRHNDARCLEPHQASPAG